MKVYDHRTIVLTTGDPQLDCAYVGQTGEVLQDFANGTSVLLLKCGHQHVLSNKSFSVLGKNAEKVVDKPKELPILTTSTGFDWRAQMKVLGFNTKEQKVFELLLDGEKHTVTELKKHFEGEAKALLEAEYHPGWNEQDVSAVAQTAVRNSLRKLCADGWVDSPQTSQSLLRGMYQLSEKAKIWLATGVNTTSSYNPPKHSENNMDNIEIKKPEVEVAPVKRPRGRPRKNPVAVAPATVVAAPVATITETVATTEVIKRKPGRPKKVLAEGEVKRGPGRPKKVVAVAEAAAPTAPAVAQAAPVTPSVPVIKRKPGRPKKVQEEAAAAPIPADAPF
jgi:hypothetical protein